MTDQFAMAEKLARKYLAKQHGAEQRCRVVVAGFYLDPPHLTDELKAFSGARSQPTSDCLNLVVCHSDKATMSKHGFHWNGCNGDQCFQEFILQPNDRQVKILEGMLEAAGKSIAAHRALGELLNRLIGSGRLNSPTLGQLHALYSRLPPPLPKRGPDPASLSVRNAMILTLMHLLRAEFPSLSLVKNPETPNMDICDIVIGAMTKEFPKLGLTRKIVSNVWEKRLGKEAGCQVIPVLRELTADEKNTLLSELEAARKRA